MSILNVNGKKKTITRALIHITIYQHDCYFSANGRDDQIVDKNFNIRFATAWLAQANAFEACFFFTSWTYHVT